MLERVQGVPLLAWLVAALAQSGARRFFLVAQAGWMSRAKACFPQDLDLTLCADQDPADLLHVFLSTADGPEEKITVVTGPAVYLPNSGARPRSVASKKTAAFFSSSRGLMEALDRDFSFSQFLMEQGAPCTQDDGFYGVSDSMELLAWQKAHESESAAPFGTAGGPDLGLGQLLCESLDHHRQGHRAAAGGDAHRLQ